MPKIVTREQMYIIELEASELGLSYTDMMENAGIAVCETITSRFEDITDVNVILAIGPGNNGGDGLVSARLLAAFGAHVNVVTVIDSNNNVENFEKAINAGVEVVQIDLDDNLNVLKDKIAEADVFVDAVFGIGARVPLDDHVVKFFSTVSDILDHHDILCVAVDCPSGMDCNTGEVDDNVLEADITVTFGAAKIGHFLFPGADVVGELVLADIGLPINLPALEAIDLDLAVDDEILDLLPDRQSNSHKGTYGTTLVVAGSTNYSGAAYLAAAGAYKMGSGLVTVAIPHEIYPIVASLLPEATSVILPSYMGVIAESGAKIVHELLDKVGTLLLGPGLGTESSTLGFCNNLFASDKSNNYLGGLGFNVSNNSDDSGGIDLDEWPFVVVDADGLKLLNEIDKWYLLLPKNSVLTPHPGEMSVLTGLTIDEIQSDRVSIAREYSMKWNHVVVLKGAYTVVANPNGHVMLHPFATSALASAGTGDVLAGMISGLLSQGMEPYQASVLGVFLHGLSAELCMMLYGDSHSIMASDILAMIPEAITSLKQ
ncbi:MAG TPA: hypothetical protein DGM69_08130 [Chloroflexi bacterium]|nr:hypothetical protein [Chloroflexota bacterium]